MGAVLDGLVVPRRGHSGASDHLLLVGVDVRDLRQPEPSQISCYVPVRTLMVVSISGPDPSPVPQLELKIAGPLEPFGAGLQGWGSLLRKGLGPGRRTL